jgi:hypothetical protein
MENFSIEKEKPSPALNTIYGRIRKFLGGGEDE